MLLISGIVQQKNLNLYSMWREKREYDVASGLVGGEPVHTLDSSTTLSCVKAYASEQLGTSVRQFILHDGCDLRKPNSRDLEYLGHVMSLSKQVVRGYKTMNSVVVDAESQTLNWLCHEVYSNKMPTYVGETVLKDPKLLAEWTAAQQLLVSKKSISILKFCFIEILKKVRTGLKGSVPKAFDVILPTASLTTNLILNS